MTTETKELTSEQRLGMTEPPSYQCSEIDGMIKTIRTCIKLAEKSHKYDEDESKSALSDIDSELWSFERDMEQLRSACERLREWGNDWKTLCKKVALESKVELQDFA